jgi:hypothetical protein
MKSAILAAAIAAVTTIPVAAEPYRSFTDVKTRASPGTTVIRAFPNASAPSFRLLLEWQKAPEHGGGCVVWLEFMPRAGTINHYGHLGQIGSGLPEGQPKSFTRRALVEGPMTHDTEGSVEESTRIAQSSFTDGIQHWVATKTNDALELLSAEIWSDRPGTCSAGTRTRFTGNLAYRDVIDAKTLSSYGEARLRGFPGTNPSFTVTLEFARAGTEIMLEGRGGGGGSHVLTHDACIMWLDLADVAMPIYVPAAYEGSPFIDLLATSQDDVVLSNDLGLMGSSTNWSLPVISLTTGEFFRFVEGEVRLANGQCTGKARLQYASRVGDLYR